MSRLRTNDNSSVLLSAVLQLAEQDKRARANYDRFIASGRNSD
jgi:hypothetical protein